MTNYRCGCESDGIIIMSTNFVDLASYLTWEKGQGVNGTRELCWYCWQEENNIKTHTHCGYKKGKWVKEHQSIKNLH